jgi:predicted acylesterase/phospholipase RssA
MMHKRLRGACLVAALSMAACAGPARREHPIYWYDAAPPAGFPETVRSVAEDRASFEKDAQRFLARVRMASQGGEVNILALSGGGAGAAFGAGALTGLSNAGTRPYFHVVTGVSAGALTAPFAFLGPAWDAKLTESFSGQRSADLVQFSLTGVLFGSSIFRGKPLADLVNHYATQEMLQAVAVEAAKGRLLLIATTDLDSERTVIWDMGAIALRGGPAGLKLFRQVLIASASIPGLFPPVMIPVETSGTVLEEMHVDGSTTASLFIAPEIASVVPDQLKDLRGAHI